MDYKQHSKRSNQEVKKVELSYGKMPAQDIEAEKAVLGAMLLDTRASDIAFDLLTEECFYLESHKVIFSAAQRLYAQHKPVEIVSVCSELKGDIERAGGMLYVMQLTNKVTSTVAVENHCRILIEKSMKRTHGIIAADLLYKAYEPSEDPFEASDYAEEELSKLRQQNVKQPFKHIAGIAVEAILKIDTLRDRSSEITGVPSGFAELDKITLGWQEPDLIILAARPAVGKTAFALTCARHAAEFFKNEKSGKSVGFFSLEMSNNQLTQRMLSATSNVCLWKIKSGRVDDTEHEMIMNASEGLSKLDIFVDDTGGLSVQEFTSKARSMKRKHNVGIIFVDYLQLMKNKEKGNREQEISSISATLKNTAKDLKIPIIALSQMSREYAKNTNREPASSDLRESGAIEQDADMVIFLYNPNEAQLMENPELNGYIFAKIDKHRSGSAPERFMCQFNKDFQQHLSFRLIDKDYNLIGNKWQPESKDKAPF